MPRKSKESMQVARVEPLRRIERLRPPPGMSPRENEIWLGVVNPLPADYLKPEMGEQLKAYCFHQAMAERLAAKLASSDPDGEWLKLSAQQIAHSKAALAFARSLRLTNQARQLPDMVGRKTLQDPRNGRKPWETDEGLDDE